ncbi:30S ribosomal protein S3 [Candidatus Phytoplasma melaleucae]|uniref:Small ribosomal subunit protein uS3 n=1 Tax=Candidatus Phytoplasma melaleucae TaxID=2982630 RepID=A0ABT9DDJ3_9MOLU|nr:30S ribosomal protein S3 ['Melaleuca sp.' phytoplasma]MDO8168121.1 30S ribosomal protein S3 ['Melaleuca sp.' phytoplasma]MDV3205251.1 30S ribosomal protein S3 [Weeping tea tree witches'-broom phytoplasma]
MGQKSSPIGLRLSLLKNWSSKWYAEDKQVPVLIHEDYRIRTFISNYYTKGTISLVEIQRLKKTNKEEVQIYLHTAKLGIVIGTDNKQKNKLIQSIQKLIQKDVTVHVIEVKNPDGVASLVAQNIAVQLEQRAFFRSVQKIAVQKALKTGVKGIKIIISGRLGGAEIARQESIIRGILPLGTFRSLISYAYASAYTVYGVIGVKVFICHGDFIPKPIQKVIKSSTPTFTEDKAAKILSTSGFHNDKDSKI